MALMDFLSNLHHMLRLYFSRSSKDLVTLSFSIALTSDNDVTPQVLYTHNIESVMIVVRITIRITSHLKPTAETVRTQNRSFELDVETYSSEKWEVHKT